jgi:uncharacterized protein YjeT (DUF2065 family)
MLDNTKISDIPFGLLAMGAVLVLSGLFAFFFPNKCSLDFYGGMKRYSNPESDPNLRFAIRLVGLAIFGMGIFFIYMAIGSVGGVRLLNL